MAQPLPTPRPSLPTPLLPFSIILVSTCLLSLSPPRVTIQSWGSSSRTPCHLKRLAPRSRKLEQWLVWGLKALALRRCIKLFITRPCSRYCVVLLLQLPVCLALLFTSSCLCLSILDQSRRYFMSMISPVLGSCQDMHSTIDSVFYLVLGSSEFPTLNTDLC